MGNRLFKDCLALPVALAAVLALRLRFASTHCFCEGQDWCPLVHGALWRLPPISCRLGDLKKEGRWAEDEVQRLQSAVQQYLDARTAAEGVNASGGGGGDELTLTMDDIEGEGVEEREGGREGGASVGLSRLLCSQCSGHSAGEGVGARGWRGRMRTWAMSSKRPPRRRCQMLRCAYDINHHHHHPAPPRTLRRRCC